MAPARKTLATLVLATALATAACTGKKTPTTPGARTPAPTVVTAQATQLTGKVKLLSDMGAGIISDNGGGIISNNSGAIISDNGGGIVANNGGGIVSNNGSAFKKRQVLEAAKPREFLLADAVIEVWDAAGKPVLDAKGKPISTTTDKQGNYTLATSLPAKNLVLHIKLWNGGELSAMLPKPSGKASQAIDTASSLGAAYVLGKYVGGSQATYDKLPAAEAARLQTDLTTAQGLIATAPTYQPDELVGLVDQLRPQVPAVDKTLEEIRVLLLGQARLGEGLAATSVAIFEPVGLALEPTGTLVLGERRMGRVRMISPEGTLSTYMDVVRGKIKQNYAEFDDMLRLPDGSLVIVGDFKTSGYVYRVWPDGQIKTLAGIDGDAEDEVVDIPATQARLHPNRVVAGPDGTLYIAEGAWSRAGAKPPPRVVSIAPDGLIHTVVPGDLIPNVSRICGLALAPDGGFDLLCDLDGGDETLFHVKDGKATTVLAGLDLDGRQEGYLARGADGTLYVSDTGAHRVVALAPDGSQKVVAGKGGPEATAGLDRPGTLLPLPDGGLLVADLGANLVHQLGKDGSWKLRAGTASRAAADLGALSLDAPGGAAFDDQGRLIVTETGANVVSRFDGKTFEKIAGTSAGFEGDGGPAASAKLLGPLGLAFANGTTYVWDLDNSRLRQIAADGTITTIAGSDKGSIGFQPFESIGADKMQLRGSGLAIGPDGRPYLNSNVGKVLRLGTDGQLHLVAGIGHELSDGFPKAPDMLPLDKSGPAAKAGLVLPGGIAFDAKGDLYITDLIAGMILKITDPTGAAPTIEPFAGRGINGIVSGAPPNYQDGVQAKDATLALPAALAFDKAGNLYVAEVGTIAVPLYINLSGTAAETVLGSQFEQGARIRKITPDGIITTVAGPGSKRWADPHAEDSLVMPAGLAISADGRLAILDSGANLIRILPAGSY
jgi:sugar lactone lactonase YvrE